MAGRRMKDSRFFVVLSVGLFSACSGNNDQPNNNGGSNALAGRSGTGGTVNSGGAASTGEDMNSTVLTI